MAEIGKSTVLGGWPVWGLPFFAAIFAPWQEKITDVRLISQFFQPTLNTVGSIIGPLSCMVAYAILCKARRTEIRRTTIAAYISLFLLLLVCVLLESMIDRTIFVGPHFVNFIRAVWILAYLGIFSALGFAMISSAILIERHTKRSAD